MNSRFTLITLCLAFLSAVIPPNAHGQSDDLKIGVIEVTLVLSEYYKWETVQEKFKEYGKELAASTKSMKEKLEEKQAEVKAIDEQLRNDTISDAVKEDSKKRYEAGIEELKQMVAEFQRRNQRSLQKIDRMKRREYIKLLDDIYKVVAVIAGSSGHDLVFDKSAISRNTNPFVLYSKDQIEFSRELIDMLNASKGKPTPEVHEKPAASSGGAVGQDVAVLDMSKVLRLYHKTTESEDQLRKVRNKNQKDIDELVLERQTANRRLRALAREKQSNPAKGTEYDRLFNELKALEQQIQQAEQANEKRLRTLHRKARFQLMEDIVSFVEEYAKTNKHTLMIDISAASPRGNKMTPYYNPKLDVTDAILKGLNPGGK